MNRRKLGMDYEEKAAVYLKENGYEILEKNYRIRSGEIDLIVRKDGITVAVEVKYRGTFRYGHPSMAVTVTKQKNISKVFAQYIFSHKLSFDAPYRFDVIGFLPDGKIRHIKNAFSYME